MTADELAAQMGIESAHELFEALGKIKHCLGQVNDQQVWRRPHRSLNSIANLMLHLCGNLGQWIVVGIGGGEDHRNRPAEFADQGPISKDELLSRLETVVNGASRVLTRLTSDQLTQLRRIQGFDVTGMAAIFNSIPHFRGHTQEIIHMTRVLLGDAYQTQWMPTTPEQGAPS